MAEPQGRLAHLRTMAGLVASRGFVAISGFIASVLWANGFSKQSYGDYQIVLAAVAVVSSFCLPGLNDAALISSAKNKDGNLSVIVRQRLLISICGAAVLVGWGLIRYMTSDQAMTLAFVFAGLAFVAIQLQPIWQSFTNGKGRFRALTIGQMMLSTATTIGVGVFVLVGATASSMLPWVVLLGQGLYAAMCLWLHRSLRGMVQNDDRDPSIVAYGHHVTAASLLAWVFSSDRLIVGEMLSRADVAVLSIAILLPAQVKVFFNAFEQVFLPGVTAAHSTLEAWRYIRPRMFPLWVGYTALGVVGFLLLPVLIPLFFSSRYVEAVVYAKWLWLSTCLTSPFVFLQSILNSQRDRKFLYLRNLISPTVTLALFGLLIPHYGLGGAIFARIVNHVMLAVWYVIYFAGVLRRERASRPGDDA